MTDFWVYLNKKIYLTSKNVTIGYLYGEKNLYHKRAKWLAR